ncbi:cycloeucalenol cycloisomerase-like [Phalaenopsis equestris]|uniref:cycloeucalenol cycloisomerase-like n=1 Tax=Phalaenopsis equestris TaxID=78828 RepID=UPI0009E55B65|nr:cycloeucalenol cycloisomerase-like [Phalaenopsis equestris]
MGGLEGKGRGGGEVVAAARGTESGSLWLAPNPSKRWGELFFLFYTPFWLTLCLGIIVPYKLYESFTELEYLLLGLVSAAPTFLIPLVFVGKVDSSRCLSNRYWVKANLWIIIFSYVGNYFWTHYFFTVLGASYTFPSWKMNNFPYYDFVDRASMYKVGSLFYAIYFVVSFPMFSRVAEKEDDGWDLQRVAVDALGAAMLVTIILDLWRISLGSIASTSQSVHCAQSGLAWFHVPGGDVQNGSM